MFKFGAVKKPRSLFRVSNAFTRKRPGCRFLPYLPDRLMGLQCVTARVIDFGFGQLGGPRAGAVISVGTGLGDLAVDSFASGVGGLEAEHVAFEFAYAADMFFTHHLEQGFDLLLLLMDAEAQLLGELNDGAESTADVGIGDRRNIDLRLGGCIGHNKLPARKRCEPNGVAHLPESQI
jgi:hypothetical protein